MRPTFSQLVLLSTLIFVAGCSSRDDSSTQPASSADTVSDQVSDIAAAEVIDDFIIIDVRSDDEWETGHLETAVHIPHTEIAQRIGEVTDDKDAKIILHCAVGGRAGKAKEALEAIGFTEVENGGGLDDVKKRFQ